MAIDGLVLVTGASGFLASHVIKQLLEEGAKVRGTVRSLKNEDKIKFLRELVPNPKNELELVEADLIKEENWAEAMKGVKYVIHVASPFPAHNPSHPDDLLKPAVEGTKTVLKAASEAGSVKRIVITSSVVSIYDASNPLPKENAESKIFTEETWTDTENPTLDAYAKSKTMAEKAAWDFVKELSDDKKIELVSMNPGMILGPILNKGSSTSIEVVKRLLNHESPAVAKLHLNIVDVRDVAAAHIKALTNSDAVGNRHLLVNKGMWMKELAQILQKEFKPQGYNIPTLTAPNFLVWMNSLLDRTYKIIIPRLGKDCSFENKRMVDVLGITPTDIEKTIIDTGNSLIEFGIAKKPKAKREKKPKDTKDGEAAAESEKKEEKAEAEKNGTEARQEIEGK